jgi:hypothetical protein
MVTRPRPYFGPRLLMGIILGFMLGLLGVFNLFLAGAVILVVLYLMGRPRRPGVNTPFGRRMTPADASTVIGLLADRHAEYQRMRIWRAGRDATPVASTPGIPINLDRPFAAYVDCEHGHMAFHTVGATFHDGRHKWIKRSCAVDDCDSVWRELA